MANIYKSQAVTGNLGQAQTINTNGLQQVSKQFEYQSRKENKEAVRYANEAERELGQAEKIYRTGLKNSMTSSFNSIMANPEFANNPKALDKEMNKIANDYVGGIQDDKIKSDFMFDYEITKGSYINKAVQNAYKIQQEQYKSNMFDSVYGGIQNAGLAFSNTVNGKGTVEDLANFMSSEESIQSSIDAKNPDGTFVFNDQQRLKMRKDYEDGLVDSITVAFSDMNENERKDFMDKVGSDSASLGIIEKDGQPVDVSLRDNVSPDLYREIKKKLRDTDMKIRSDKLKEENLIKKETIANYMKNPTQAGLDLMIASYPELTDTQIERFTEMYNRSPNWEAKNEEDAELHIDDLLMDLADSDYENIEGMFDKSTGIMETINNLNRDGVLIEDTADMYKNKVATILADESYKRSYSEIKPERNAFMNAMELVFPIANRMTGAGIEGEYKSPESTKARFVDVETEEQSKAKQIAKETMAEAYSYLDQGDTDTAKKVFNQGKKRLIWLTNPEFANKEIGETAVVNGMVMRVLGYGDDVLVERVQK